MNKDMNVKRGREQKPCSKFLFLFIFAFIFVVGASNAYADVDIDADGNSRNLPSTSAPQVATSRGAGNVCGSTQCKPDEIIDHHDDLRRSVKNHISSEFNNYRGWLFETFLKQQVLPALMLFTEQMSAVAMHQTMIIGTFFDAKQQLETQRTIQDLQTQAHKDYQPSEDFCWFGTNVRSLANTEAKARYNSYMLSRRQMARHLGQKNMGGSVGRSQDKQGRWKQFKERFCDPKDNGWSAPGQGLSSSAICGSGTSDPFFTNADIDYTRIIENERTIGVSPPDGDRAFNLSSGFQIQPSELAVMALGNNLYGHDVITNVISGVDLKTIDKQEFYMALRSVAAKRSVAENSFNAIVGMKAEGSTTVGVEELAYTAESVHNETWKYLGAILTELGIPQDEIKLMVGARPSYYAQLEILGKKIYQNPNFFANLYDTPTNIKRKSVALKAIDLMLDRAIYESQIRQEMVSSVLLSARLHGPTQEARAGLTGGGE